MKNKERSFRAKRREKEGFYSSDAAKGVFHQQVCIEAVELCDKVVIPIQEKDHQ